MLNNLLDDTNKINPYDSATGVGRPQIFSILVVMLILAACMITYFVKSKKYKVNEAPKGYVLLVDIYVGYIRSLVVEILGPKFEKITPYFLFLMSYILLSNLIGIVGLENPTSSLTVTLSMGFVT
ncbi:MAG: F0F1 ATP synthase subunit A [Mycoplasmoidaceae bacterium]|nr:F0F1 ATP synthase subunit A [Mycoplasmoidaceae bacterium]